MDMVVAPSLTYTIEAPKPAHRLAYAAPRRMSVEGPDGWYSIPWTEDGVREYLRIGGWFKPGYSDFENRVAAKLAGNGVFEE